MLRWFGLRVWLPSTETRAHRRDSAHPGGRRRKRITTALSQRRLAPTPPAFALDATRAWRGRTADDTNVCSYTVDVTWRIDYGQDRARPAPQAFYAQDAGLAGPGRKPGPKPVPVKKHKRS